VLAIIRGCGLGLTLLFLETSLIFEVCVHNNTNFTGMWTHQ